MTRVPLSAAIAALGLLLAVSTSCKSTQPTQNEKQLVSLSFAATADLTETWDCWDLWTSPTHNPGVGDVDLNQVFCERQTDFLNGAPAPWAYDAEISIIHAGETAESVVASSVNPTGLEPPGIRPFDNVTPPDLRLFSGSVLPPAQDIDPDTAYLNPRRVTRSSPVYAKFAHLTNNVAVDLVRRLTALSGEIAGPQAQTTIEWCRRLACALIHAVPVLLPCR
jgi:hypothetical protein